MALSHMRGVPRSQLYAALLSIIPAIIFYAENGADLRLPGPTYEPIAATTDLHLPPIEPDGVFAPNHLLHKAATLHKESVQVGPDGGLYMLDKYGVVLRTAAREGAPLERLAQLGAGRPLGFDFDGAGNLIVCNAATGLQLVERDSHRVLLLASEAPTGGNASRIRYANDLSVARDGSVYFTDSSDIPPPFQQAAGFYDTLAAYIATMQRGRPAGRVLRWEPGSGAVSVLADGLRFPNGVALSDDESFLLVVETSAARVHRLWLAGPKAGQLEVFLEDTPGLPMWPDGISCGSDGTFWLALVAPRLPALETVMGYRLARWLMARGPPSLRTPFKRAGAAVQLDGQGRVLRYLADADGSHVASLSAVTETREGLFLGNLAGDSVAFLAREHLPPPLSAA